MIDSRSYNTITFESNDKIVRIYLNRPQIHNAFNEVMISELLDLYQLLAENKEVRIVVLTGTGTSFCAGADLKWMQGIIHYSYQQNYEESLNLARLFHTIYSMSIPTVAVVQGAAIGGGAGLAAVNDIVIASNQAKFSLSEVRLGLVPACISPYIIRKIGENKSRELFLTGRRIDADTAYQYGLVNQVVPEDELDEAVEKTVSQLMSGSPAALKICKELLANVPHKSLSENIDYTARVIANLRVSDEGQEGMNAFFEKRKPKWSH
ncbi:enoyl-CoA hydratase/isomerase family protein [candidate division KSB1 bacterium]|nr:enoyl-CoA hydratase/isomerase family protein [candidate division KSB1 bacterium]